MDLPNTRRIKMQISSFLHLDRVRSENHGEVLGMTKLKSKKQR
jgi:hypothetical protein